jgi:hypothetical protein
MGLLGIVRLRIPTLSTAALSLLAAGLGIALPLHAQTYGDSGVEDARTARAVRVETPPVLDGRIDDEAWAAAPAISEFVQHEPLEGQPPNERTEVFIVFDGAAVYVGARMLDRTASGILLGENRRDAEPRDADALLILLDTYHDRQNAYVFGTTPAGIEYDGQVTKDGQGGLSAGLRAQAGAGVGGGFNLNWDGSWDVATSIDEHGWSAEFRIPFSTLRYPGGGTQVWGMNIGRTIRRTNEEVFWAPVPRQHPLFRVSEAGTLEGVETPARRWVSVTPYALSSAHRDFEAGSGTDWSGELGGDAKIGLTPSLNLDLTLNTDFAQVEADEQQINLDRFSLFFPEKRPFFLENAGTFSVGIPRSGSDLGLDLFYSRRIGIGEGGEPVPIVGGGRLTGKAAGLTLGLLNIQTEAVGAGATGVDGTGTDPDGETGESTAIAPQNYSVARVLRELPNLSQVGGMFLSRLNTASTGDYTLTYSIDGRLGIGESIDLDGFLSRTETPGLGGRDHALALTASFQNRDWDAGLQYREVGEDFNPEVGFVPRDDHRLIIARLQRNIRVPALSWIRQLQPHVLARDYYNFDGFQETRYIHIDNAIAFENGARLSTAVNVRREGLKDPFEISDGIVLPAATYDFVETLWRFNTNESARWFVNGVFTAGELFSGNRKSIQTTLTNRVGSTWLASLRLSYDDVDLEEGSFENTLVGVKVAYSFTPRIFLQSLVQYNAQLDDVSANVRFGWLNTAGTGLFLVFNEVRRTASPTGPMDRAFIVKFTRQFDLAR